MPYSLKGQTSLFLFIFFIEFKDVLGVFLWEYSCHYINSKQRSFFPLFITKEAAHTHTHTHTHTMFLKAQRSKTNNCEYPHQGKPQRCQDVSVFCTPLRVCVRAKSLQSCPTLCNPVDCSPPGSSVHGILQAGIKAHLWHRLHGWGVLYHWATWEAPLCAAVMVKLSTELGTDPGTLGPTPDCGRHSIPRMASVRTASLPKYDVGFEPNSKWIF